MTQYLPECRYLRLRVVSHPQLRSNLVTILLVEGVGGQALVAEHGEGLGHDLRAL